MPVSDREAADVIYRDARQVLSPEVTTTCRYDPTDKPILLGRSTKHAGLTGWGKNFVVSATRT
jgi:hypothetical protein